jgi:hypothetical protein
MGRCSPRAPAPPSLGTSGLARHCGFCEACALCFGRAAHALLPRLVVLGLAPMLQPRVGVAGPHALAPHGAVHRLPLDGHDHLQRQLRTCWSAQRGQRPAGANKRAEEGRRGAGGCVGSERVTTGAAAAASSFDGRFGLPASSSSVASPCLSRLRTTQSSLQAPPPHD